MVTVADGRAALGVTTSYLNRGYSRANDIARGTSVLGLKDERTVVDYILGTPDQRAAAIGLLDGANSYAQQVYGELSARPDSEPIGDLLRRKVATVFGQATDAFALIDNQAATSILSDWLDAVRAVIVGAAQGLEFVTKSIAQGVTNVTTPILLAAAAVLALYFVVTHG